MKFQYSNLKNRRKNLFTHPYYNEEKLTSPLASPSHLLAFALFLCIFLGDEQQLAEVITVKRREKKEEGETGKIVEMGKQKGRVLKIIIFKGAKKK